MHILVLNGPNLNMLGVREPAVYGSTTLHAIEAALRTRAEQAGVTITAFQSNHEGELVDQLHAQWNKLDAIIINPGALTHYGLSLRDALSMFDIPIIEVHLSNVYAREPFRHSSVIAPIATGQISGLGWQGYVLALEWLLKRSS